MNAMTVDANVFDRKKYSYVGDATSWDIYC